MVRKYFLSALMLVPPTLVTLLLTSCGGALSSDTFSEIRKERIVPVGTVPFEAPLLYQTGGELVGPEARLANQIVGRIENVIQGSDSRREIELKWITRNYGTLVAALKNREVDLVLGVFGITEARRQEVSFSEPYYTSELVLVINPVHQDLRPNTLTGMTIGVREGTAAAEFVEGTYGDSDVMPFGTLDEAVLALKRAEVDAVVDDRYMAAYALDTVPGVRHLEMIPGKLATVDCGVAVRPSDTPLLELVNEVVAQVKSEDLYATWLNETAGDVVARVEKRHGDRLEKQRRAEQPRRLIIRVSKDRDYDFDIYRMANLSFTLVEQGSGKSYHSSRIDFRNRVGISSTTIPPGTYRIVMPKMNNWSPGAVSIVSSDPDQVTVTIRLQKGGQVVMRRS